MGSSFAIWNSCSEQPSMMSQSDFPKNAGRWGGSDVAKRHYRAAVLSNGHYAAFRIMPRRCAFLQECMQQEPAYFGTIGLGYVPQDRLAEPTKDIGK